MLRSVKDALRKATPGLWFKYRVTNGERIFAHEFKVLGPLLDKNANVVDAGANIGIFSRFFAARVKQVYAYEPDPVLFETLTRFAVPNVAARNLGLSDHAGNAVLSTPLLENQPHRGTGSVAEVAAEGAASIGVRLTRLDDEELRNIRLIKIDVEGHELALLRGGKELLRAQRPYLWIEVERRFHAGRSLGDVLAEIESYGYRAFYFEPDGRKVPASQLDPARQQKELTDPEFVNNFLFEPA